VNLPKFAYFRGEFVPYSEAKVGVLTHGLNYGTAVFGGMRAYWNEAEEQLYVFRPRDHFQRFLNSARIMRMECAHNPESLTELTIELLLKENYRCDVYIRPLIFKSDEIIGVKLHDLHDDSIVPSYERYNKRDERPHHSPPGGADDNMIPQSD
jgi:branched-chain amino acid aminotransferase